MCPQGFESAQSNLSADQHLRPLWQGHIPLGAAPEISPVMKRQVIPASRAAPCECVFVRPIGFWHVIFQLKAER